ncbi:hypothetical protein [Nocardia carnea]|nr:hypothetical protein [Nocardia carnea]
MVQSLAAFVLGYAATGLRMTPDSPVETPREPAVDAGSYPLFAVAAGRSDRSSRFEFALDALLSGFGTAISAAAVTDS